MPRGRPKKKPEPEVTQIPVEENTDLVRDVATNAIINTNRSAFSARLKRKAQVQHNADEIQNLKTELSEIKELLKELIASK